MPRSTVLLIARRSEAPAWEESLRAHGLEVIRADARKEKGSTPVGETPSVVVVSEKLPFAGALRVTRDLRKDPATREIPVVLVGVHPFTTVQRVRLGASAPDVTVPPKATPEQIAAAVEEALRTGKKPPVELTPTQQQGLKYARIGTLLMVFGVIFSFPSMGSTSGSPGKAWYILLIPLGGLVSDFANGRVDGRRRWLSWQGWAAVVIMVAMAVSLVIWPGFSRWASR